MIIEPILIGEHKKNEQGEICFLEPHTGAVTLIQQDGKNILVDVGARGYLPDIIKNLAYFNVTIDKIDYVILTHLHLDHCYNISQFPNSRVIAWFHEWQSRKAMRIDKIDGYEPVPGVKIIATPGHAEEHLSVVVKNDEGKTVVIAGDAMSQVYALTQKLTAFSYNDDQYNQSAKKILGIADIIIPGHGDWFDNRE